MAGADNERQEARPDLIEDDLTAQPPSANDEAPGPGIDAGMPTPEETAARVRNAELIGQTQEFNEVLANVPREYSIGEKTVYIHSKPMGDIIRLDGLIIQFQKLTNTVVSTREDQERFEEDPQYLSEMYDRLSERQVEIWDLVKQIVVGVANGPDTPKDDKLTIKDVERITLEQANEIIDAYIYYNDIEGLLKNVTGARSF